jgi:multiple sugar transport system substrate-binding protein
MKKQSRLLVVLSLLMIASFVISCAAPAAPTAAPAAPAAKPAATTAPAAPAAAAPAAPAAAPSAAPAAAAPAAATKDFSGELTFWSGYPEFKPLYDKVGADFQKLYPKVKVTFLTSQLRDHEQKLASAIPTDTGPDLYEGSLFASMKLVDAGLLPATPDWVVSQTKGWWDESVLKYFTINGKRYTVPFFEGRAAMFYNKDCFKEAGLAEPSADTPMDWNTFLDAVKKTTKRDASGKVTRAGLSLRLSGQGSGVGEKFWIMGIPRGFDPITVDASGKYKMALNSDAGQKNLQTYLDMLYTLKTDSIDLQHDSQGFELGQSCMFQRESWVIGDIAKNAPTLNYGTMPMPSDVRSGTLRSPIGMWVTKSAKNPELAWTFAMFMANAENQNYMLDNVGWLPSRMDVDYSAVLNKKPAFKAFLPKDPNYKWFYYPQLGVFDEIQTKYSDRLVKAYLDSSLATNPAGVKKVLDDANVEANAILKRDGKGGE